MFQKGAQKIFEYSSFDVCSLNEILYNVGTTIRSLTGLETYPQVSN